MIYIQHSYSRVVHNSTGKSPFETFFGYIPPFPLDVVYGNQGVVMEDIIEEVLKSENFVESIRKIHFKEHEILKKSYEKYKAPHDQHKIEKIVKVGDKVWLQLNKEILEGHGKRIKALRYGTFEVLEKVGYNAYTLNLPPYMCIYR
jgi:hypothetical protein